MSLASYRTAQASHRSHDTHARSTRQFVGCSGRCTSARQQIRVHAANTARMGHAFPVWQVVFETLQAKNLRTVAPEDASQMLESGNWVLLDVRLPAAHESSHPTGSVSAPLYRPIDYSQLDVVKVLKTIAYRFNGVNPVEPNPDFIDRLRQLTADGKGVITMCEAGGTMKPSTNFPEGKASRSLQAAFKILDSGITDQVHAVPVCVIGCGTCSAPSSAGTQPLV